MPECYLSQNHVYFFFFLLNFLNAINTQRNGQVWNYIMLYNKNFNLLVLILFEFFFSETTVYHSQQSDYKLFFKFKLKRIVTIRRSA